MYKQIALVTVLSIAPLLAQAGLTPLESEARSLSRAQQVAQANLLMAQEQTYSTKLKSLASKAESNKETELAQKLKDEIALSDARIEDYKQLVKGEPKLFGIKFVTTDGSQWVIIKNATTIVNNWHPDDKSAFKVVRVGDMFAFVKDGKPTNDGFLIGDNGNSITVNGVTHYRPGFRVKEPKKVEAPKSDTEDTPFGKRVRF